MDKIELGGITIYEKKDPSYKSKVFGVPVWILVSILAVMKIKR